MESPTHPSDPFSQPGNDGSSKRMFVIAAVAMVAMLGAVALVFRGTPRKAAGPPPYISNIKIAHFKMSAAENFVGATVSYVDGTVTNAGSQVVTHIEADVVFKDDLGQVVQHEAVPLKILKTGGPYPEAVDVGSSPLAPGQSQTFRLTFEGISTQWNQQYPEIKVSDVSTTQR